MIPALRALGQALRRTPIKPTSVAALLGNHAAYLAFRAAVREVFPGQEAEILAAHGTGASRETARVWAFLHRVEAEFFPVYELEEYEQVAYGIPFVRNGWSLDRLHDIDLGAGELLLFALCEQPYEDDFDSRVPLLDACEAHVPAALLREIPQEGIAPALLHERLDDTPYQAVADYADWLWGDTGTVFLDFDDEVDVSDADWTRENIVELTAQWQRADAILDRIAGLTKWLEEDLPARFSQLLAAALGRDPELNYERTRRLYACEITESGIVAIPHEDPEPIALPPDPAA
jgi:hypothetical protein